MWPDRATYSEKHISEYFKHISLPKDKHDLPSTPAKLHEPQNALNFLITLQQLQLCTVPFENLALHYSPHHTISLDLQHLYNKIVERKHGGYCMEANYFFGTMLRSLGFSVYSVGARVSYAADGLDGENFAGWSHMVNIATLADGKRYMLDVGFGSNGPVRPLLLDPEHGPVQGIKPAEMRLTFENIAQNSDPNQKLWVYQHRNDPESDWMPLYCFTELEFLPQDYEIMNFWTSQSRRSWFTTKIVVVKMLMERGEIVGTLILTGGVLKKRVGGKTEQLKDCEKDEERVELLKEYFGVELTDAERAGIRGLTTELKR